VPFLIGALSEVGEVLFVGVDGVVDQAHPVGIPAAVAPSGGRHEPFDLEQIGVDEQPNHRLHVVGLHVVGRDVGEHHDAGLQ
jgi:hypothetical protein